MLAAKCCKVRQILRSLEFLKAKQRCFHKDMFLHRCLHIHMHVSTKLFLHANTFTHKCFYTGMLLQTDARVLLHTDAFTQRCCYRGNAFTPFYTRLLVTQNSLYTQKLLQSRKTPGPLSFSRNHKMPVDFNVATDSSFSEV